MSLLNYGELKTGVAARSMRSDLAAFIPDFVRRAHDTLVSEVEIAADLSLSAASAALPTDFRLLVSVALTSRTVCALTQSSEAEMANLGTGQPRYYRVAAQTLYVAPTPVTAYPAQVVYKVVRTFFTDDADANTIMTRYPLVYLYGSMAELFAHTRNLPEQSKYETMFRSEIERINGAEQEDAWAGALQATPSGIV